MDKEIYEALKDERKTSDESYAIKLVEKVVFGLVAMICITFIAAVIKLIIQ